MQLTLDHEQQVISAADGAEISSFALYFDGECYLADLQDEKLRQPLKSTAPGSEVLQRVRHLPAQMDV